LTQSVDPDRYTVVPRTLAFLTRPGYVLLTRLPDDHPDWPGCYNGVGGHIERGEDAASAARREIVEETGLVPRNLRLCGTVWIDTGVQPGIALLVFTGEAEGAPAAAGAEVPRWTPRQELEHLRLVQDLRVLLPRALDRNPDDPPFSALYRYDASGRLRISFDGEGESVP